MNCLPSHFDSFHMSKMHKARKQNSRFAIAQIIRYRLIVFCTQIGSITHKKCLIHRFAQTILSNSTLKMASYTVVCTTQ